MAPALVLPRSARLAAFAGGWLAGGGSLDDVLSAVHGDDGPHLVTALPETSEPVGLVVALAALRAQGVRGLRLALPVSGDPLGLPGPPALTEAAVAAGEAAVAVGAGWALVPAAGPPVRWSLVPATLRPVDVPGLSEGERGLALAVSAAASDLAALDVAGAAATTLAALADLRPPRDPLLPPGYDARAEHLAGRALRLLAVTRLARCDDGAAVSGSQLARRAAALDPLDRAARRALVAAVGSALEPSRG